MTATNIFFSTTTPNMDRPYAAQTSGGTAGSLNQGFVSGTTSERAADFLELRVMVYTTGTTKTNVTKKDIEDFLDLCQRWVRDPVNTDSLDYVLSANSVAAAIP